MAHRPVMKVMTVRLNRVGIRVGKTTFISTLKGFAPMIAGRFHGVVVDAADGVAQEQHMVGGTGEGHGEQHRPEPGEPVAC